MCKFNMFITAVCVLFLIKLRWPKNKSITIIIIIIIIIVINLHSCNGIIEAEGTLKSNNWLAHRQLLSSPSFHKFTWAQNG